MYHPARGLSVTRHPQKGHAVVEFKEVKIPKGDLIQFEAGRMVVGDHPIIGYLRGDGIGLDITPVMQHVVESAISKAYGDSRRISWSWASAVKHSHSMSLTSTLLVAWATRPSP